MPLNDVSAIRAAWRVANGVVQRDTACFRVAAADDTVRVYVYDMIGGWDNDASEFVRAVHGIDAATIALHINSPGGLVYDAVAMFEALDAHPARVETHIDGLAASAASFLALAGDSIDIAAGGKMMVHDAQGAAIGSPAEIREYADLLESISDDIAGFYARRAGGDVAEWRNTMRATTWYSADQAVSAGLADAVRADGKKVSGPDNRTRLIKARLRAINTLGGVK